jgi:Fe-Mn family superoxide dismutase
VVRTRDGAAEIRITHDAGCPLTAGDWPLLACDLWEHAYYIDYRNLRGRYLESFWPLANWELAEARFEAAGRAPAALGRPQSGGPLRSA